MVEVQNDRAVGRSVKGKAKHEHSEVAGTFLAGMYIGCH